MNGNSSSFSCFLVGSDSLLAQCGEVLLARGHTVLGVVTHSKQIGEWARRHSISVLDAAADYTSVLRTATFDYLFSITHLELLPEAAVKSPRRLAINFHDGPLPRYAGLNTPMWALLNGEDDYAISWHIVAPGIDTGDIVLQQPVAIGSDETALSLNTKCFAAALESFPTLLAALERGEVTKTPQELSRRTYYSRSKRPEAACVLDWRRPAALLERTVRALDTGRYANPLGNAKALFGERAIIVRAASVQPQSRGAAVGTVVSVSSSHIAIQTGEGLLAITAAADLDGGSIEIAELPAKLGLTEGSVLPIGADEVLARLTAIASDCARSEHYWSGRLPSVLALDLPYRRRSDGDQNKRFSVELDVPPAFTARGNELSLPFAVAGAFVQFLGRVAGTMNLDVAISDAQVSEKVQGFESLFTTHGFVSVALDAAAPAWEQASRVVEQSRSALAKAPWLRDLVARQPALKSNALAAGAAPPVAIVFGEPAKGTAVAAELALVVPERGAPRLECASTAYTTESAAQLAEHFGAVLAAMSANGAVRFNELDLINASARQLLLAEWQGEDVEYDRALSIHAAFEQQARKTPGAIAVAFGDREISYRDLDKAADRVARRLRAVGIRSETLVGVHVERSIELVVAILGVLKSGAAYVPLDPAFPPDRLKFMIADSGMPVVLSQGVLADALPADGPRVLYLEDAADAADAASEPPAERPTPSALAYVLYTSGSTGRPKGVMVEHRNVINFFAGMDKSLPRDARGSGVWLAVTSLSFDISVLELLWTLTRGFKVVVHDEKRAKTETPEVSPARLRRPVGLGLFMWGNDDAPGKEKYRLLIEGAKYFDENGFASVWTPERHFHAFGGPYPNPAVTSAAVAAVTKNVRIRAGSCVVPLHHPVRIAEEWSVVDNLSDGRVEIAAASGWNPNDFVLRPESHAKNKDVMFTTLDQVQRLWAGEKLAFPGPLGKDVVVGSLPRPVQAKLPIWITTAGNPETWRAAGAGGFNVLTHLLGQTFDEVAEKIRVYREARAAAGFEPQSGQIALMLHTYVGDDDEDVRELVRAPMKSYLASSMRLAMNFAWSFPAFKRPGGQESKPEDVDLAKLTSEEVDTILDFAFDRYFETSGLFGSVDTCLRVLEKCSEIGVTEVACLLDFGVATDTIMQSLPKLKELKQRADASLEAAAGDVATLYSFAGAVRRHQVTHLQCTPSMARMYLADAEARAAMADIPHKLLGGEALPLELAKELKGQNAGGTLTNMYGPTETTIWSMTHAVDNPDAGIPIGRPIANTRIYVLDKQRRPAPIGVPGELFIGGDGVARGYLNRAELTAERFVPDPFLGNGARMYATGDLAKYRPTGEVDFLGRIDFQVKIRGYRIELGEIEALLEGHDGVAEAAVVVRAADQADLRLVAFVVRTDGAALESAALRRMLREQLPDYMVPSEITFVAEMPRTANGKLDRKALQSIKAEAERSVADATLPHSETERTIAELWQKTLKLEKVGIDENFFDLGGHSLLVIQLHSQLKSRINQPLSLTDLYQYPTIRSLSNYLSSGRHDETLQMGTSRGARRRALRSRSA